MHSSLSGIDIFPVHFMASILGGNLHQNLSAKHFWASSGRLGANYGDSLFNSSTALHAL